MKYLIIHVWLAINIAILASIYLKPSLAYTPIWVVMFFLSGLLLKSKGEIRAEYSRPLPWQAFVVTFIIIGALVYAAFSGLTSEVNIEAKPETIQTVATLLGIFIGVMYVWILNKARIKKT